MAQTRRSGRSVTRRLPETERRERGRQTRRKMLAAIKSQLQEGSIRDLRVVAIANVAGVSSAAFYQYFADMDEAILALADEMVKEARVLTDLMRGDWENDGAATTDRVVEGFLEFWIEHEAVLRIVELAIDERDPRFNHVRSAMLNEATVALSFVIDTFQQQGVQPSEVNSRALAASLIAVLVHVSSRMWLYDAWGLGREQLKAAMGDILFTMVTRQGLRAPSQP